MPFKPNYKQARNDRSRSKDQKKQEKLRRREEETQRRKADDGPADPVADTGAVPSDEQPE